MTKKLSIITLTYNQLEEATKPFLKSLYKNTDPELFELIIVDNNSQDKTVEYLKDFETKHNNVKVIYNNENLGYSKGNNQGLKIAQGEFIALLNNDIILSPEWYKPLFDKLIAPPPSNTGLVSCNVIEAFFTKESNFLKIAKKYARKADTEYIKSAFVYFPCVMFTRQFLDKVSYLDEKFSPAYYEDDDYSIRSILNGYTNYISTQSYIYHKTSSTSLKLPAVQQLLDRNKKYFNEKYKDNVFIEYLQELNHKYSYINPRFEKAKRYKKTSIQYYCEKIISLVSNIF